MDIFHLSHCRQSPYLYAFSKEGNAHLRLPIACDGQHAIQPLFLHPPPPTHTRLARGMSRSCAPQPAATTPCTSHSLASRAREKRRKREMKWEACALKKKGYYTQGRNRVVVLVLGRSHPPHHITESAACPCPCSAASVHRPSAHGRRVRSARSASSHPAACPCARFLRRG